MLNRRQFIGYACGLGACFAGPAAYARLVEPRWLRTQTTPLALPGFAPRRTVRLLHLSDFHLSDVVPLSFIGEAIERGLALKPDLICMTGDYVTGRIADANAYRAVLARLSAAAPSFACLGNHDGGAWVTYRGGYADTGPVRRLLQQSGIQVLTNTSETVNVHGEPISIIGLGYLWAHEFEPEQAFAAEQRLAKTRIVLTHNPDGKDELRDYPWDLLLCGHTHGGQVDLPFIGTPFAPVKDQRFVSGLHQWRGRQLYITRGVGNLHGIRFNCRPEVSLLLLKPV